MRTGQRVDLEIHGVADGGQGVGRVNGNVVFVPQALPGEKVRVQIKYVGKRKVSATLLDVLTASADRVSAPCRVFGLCGGCQLMHAAYPTQLELKQTMLKDALRTIAGLHIEEEILIHPAPAQLGYRNRGQYPVALQDGRLVTGFFAPRSHRVVPVDSCLIHDPRLDQAVSCVCSWAKRKGIQVYDEHRHQGLLRHVVVRTTGSRRANVRQSGAGHTAGELLVALVGTRVVTKGIGALVRLLRRRLPQTLGVMININSARTNVILGKQTRLLWGRDWVRERIGDLRFKLSLGSFFQVNTLQAEVLFDRVTGFIGTPGGTVVDAYCGVGVLGLLLASRGHEVEGIEAVRNTVQDARKASSENGVARIRFHHGTVEKVLPGLVKQGLRPDTVVLDPPRKGCAQEVLRAISESGARRVAYVSCHPGTLARDLAVLFKMGFRMEILEGVDMFPQTVHLEVFAGLVRSKL